ncbi:MAG: hypothetical protein U0452_14485 [Anaerolineae bacterium]
MRPNARTRVTEMERPAVKAEMAAILIACARQRQTITYGGLCDRLTTVTLDPGTFIFSHLLREVCGEEYRKGHGQLCALVVSKATGMPSSGYFAREIVDMNGPETLEALWHSELEDTFARWADEAEDG